MTAGIKAAGNIALRYGNIAPPCIVPNIITDVSDDTKSNYFSTRQKITD